MPSNAGSPSGPKFKKHQLAASLNLKDILLNHKMAYLVGAPRSGKTRTALKTIHNLKAENVLVLCPKNAIDGWASEIEATDVAVSRVTNYEQAKKVPVPQGGWDLVVIDEAHNLGAYPKTTQRSKDIKKHTLTAQYMLCLSGTPCVESPSQLYHSFYWLRSRTGTFYDWHRRYGVSRQKFFGGRSINDYSQCKPEVIEGFGRLNITMTQADAGIKVEVEDVLHEVQPSEMTVLHLNELRRHGMSYVGDALAGKQLVAESEMAMRAMIHQIESGALTFEDEFIGTGCTAVLDYISANFNKRRDAVMAHYKATQKQLKKAGWTVYSSQASAEGVDLSHHDNLIIVNAGYSGAKHLQRRERLVNMAQERDRIAVHHITVKGGISPDVYESVSNKRDFNLSSFRKWRKQ